MPNCYQSLHAILFFIFILAGCKQTEVTPIKSKDLVPVNEHLMLGNPSDATADPANASNFLLQKPQYTVSYSRDLGIPNWVS